MTDIVIINQSSVLTDAQLMAWLPAFQTQITRDFVPFWGASATLHFCAGSVVRDPSWWPVYILDHSDEAGDLGYHEDAGALPSARIFAADDILCGSSCTVTITHELLEMLADPEARRMAPDGRHILEVCDPVEADDDGYDIDGVRVSNFVLPAWFGLANAGEDQRVDFRGLLSAPWALRPGGYLEYFDGQNWVQRRARLQDGTHSRRSTRLGRSFRHAIRGAPV